MQLKAPATILLLHIVLIIAAVAAATDLPMDEHGDYNGVDLIEWINAHPQGYVHPSLRIGRRIPGDPTSIIGTFVSSDAKPIEAGDILATIPWDCMIGPGNEYSLEIFESCRAVRNLADELKLGDQSQYKPYVNYLLRQSTKMMPGEWSISAQEFLHHKILDRQLPPLEADWFGAAGYKQWLKNCGGNSNDAMERLAYYLTSTRDEDTLMIPIYDMMNHSNDPKKLNTLSYKPKSAGESFVFKASRKIEPSEEIFNCYNRCNTCSKHFREECETFSFRGTPDIFAHYGFVEELPQYWWFERQSGNEVIEMEFCLEKNATTDEPDITWIGSVPTAEDKSFYTQHLERLRQIQREKEILEPQLVQSDGENSQGKMTRSEWEACWNYRNTLVIAIELVLESIHRIEGGEGTKVIVYSQQEDDSGDEL
jgi:hypothetical protein